MNLKLLVSIAALFFVFTAKVYGQADDLMIVEYADWNSGSGLLVEIYNPTCDTIDLSDYKIGLYENEFAPTSPLGGKIHALQGFLAPKATLVIRNQTTTPTNFASCYKDTVMQLLGLTGNAALVLSKGSSPTNFVDMVGAYGFNLCTILNCGSYPQPTPKTGGVKQALYINRIVRDTNNLIRYTSIDGTSVNSWPHDTATNVPGWKVGGGGTCIVKGFTAYVPPQAPVIKGLREREVCSGLDSSYQVTPGSSGSKLKWVLKSTVGSMVSGLDSTTAVTISFGNTPGYDTLIVYEYTSCASGGQVLLDTIIIEIKDCGKACVVINEIMISPVVQNNDSTGYPGEWVELYNTCCDTIDISCYRLSNGKWGLTFPSGAVLLPFSFYTIGSDSNFHGKPDLNITTCNCLSTSGSSPAYGAYPDNAGQLVLYDTAGKIQDAIVWGGGQGLPATQSSPSVGSCGAKSVNVPANNGNNYKDIGAVSAGASKARVSDGDTVWTNKAGSLVSFKNSNDGGLISVMIDVDKHDTLFGCGQPYTITTRHTGTGKPTWSLKNGNATSTTFNVSLGGDSIFVNNGNAQGADTFIVSKINPLCVPVYDTVFRLLKPCKCTWVIKPFADTAICVNKTLQSQSNVAADWYRSKNNALTPIVSVATQTTLNPRQAGVDTFVVIHQSCPDTVKVTYNALPAITGLADTAACPGDSVTLTPTISNNTAFRWFPAKGLSDSSRIQPKASPLATTQYLILLTDSSSGCSIADSFVFTVKPKPVISGLTNKTLCLGDSVMLSPTITNAAFVSWSPSTGLSCTTCFQPYTKPVSSLTYTITAASPGNCADSQQVTVSVITPPTVQAGPGDTLCAGESTTLTATGAISYQWNTGDTTASIIIKPASSAYYYVQGRTGNCFGSVDSVRVVVSNTPVASFTADRYKGEVPLTIKFTNTSSQSTTYKWLRGTELFSENENPDYTITDTGIHTITLVAINGYGCSDTISFTISVLPTLYINVPNVFTPNGDSLNDYFEVTFAGISQLKGSVYNRWGEELHKFEYPANNWWTGIYRGDPCPDGVYFCVITYKDSRGIVYNYSGTLTLIR